MKIFGNYFVKTSLYLLLLIMVTTGNAKAQCPVPVSNPALYSCDSTDCTNNTMTFDFIDNSGLCSIDTVTFLFYIQDSATMFAYTEPVIGINGMGTAVITGMCPGTYIIFDQSCGAICPQSFTFTVTPGIYIEPQIEVECDSFYWNQTFTTYTSSGIYTDTVSNGLGCDSLITLNLTINNSSIGVDEITACESYTWIDGVTYTSDNNTSTYTYISASGCDSTILLDLTINNTNSSTIDVSTCFNYVSPSGNYVWGITGTYYDTLLNVLGCDSVITINLTIFNSINTNVIFDGSALISLDSNSLHQWMWCDSSIIEGETSLKYFPQSNGSYAVILTENGCVDTSDCYNVLDLGILVNDFGSDLVVSPNPTFGKVLISLGALHYDVRCTVLGINGEVISSDVYDSATELSINIEGESGFYILDVSSQGEHTMIKLLKE